MTIPDRITAARLRVVNQIELDTARAKSDIHAVIKPLTYERKLIAMRAWLRCVWIVARSCGVSI